MIKPVTTQQVETKKSPVLHGNRGFFWVGIWRISLFCKQVLNICIATGHKRLFIRVVGDAIQAVRKSRYFALVIR